MSQETPVLDTIAAMTAASIENTSLDARELMLCRIAALAAMDAPAISYLANIGPAADSGVTLDDARGVLTAVAPIIGTPRTVTAAANITRALGFAIVAIEAELQAQIEAEED
jgi:alkylhydroperoxidase/carboxymuconolactone decarboxylase family protein YurZ